MREEAAVRRNAKRSPGPAWRTSGRSFLA